MNHTDSKYDNTPHDPAECQFCKRFHEFDLPEPLIAELLSSGVVLFAGAGISTEDKSVFPCTFYEEIRSELKVPETESLSFSGLMTKYCAQMNGRANLLRKIRERFEYTRSFPELYRIATRFHYELSTLFFIESIVTTNWDDYFERECGATAFVMPKDFAFWSLPGRKVFKLHGSITNLGSIVATSADYQQCYKRLQKGILGSSLKMMLATKTILYVGYSFRDEDFTRIHSMLRKDMGELMPRGFIVTLDRGDEQRYRELGLIPIFTDATNFISVIKQHFIEGKHMLPDEVFEEVSAELTIVRAAHHRLWDEFNIIDTPDILYAASYQDGLIHAFERMLGLHNSGYYSHIANITNAMLGYYELRKAKVQIRKYPDIAYIDGYTNGLLYLLHNHDIREMLPLYYIFGARQQPRSFDEFSHLLERAFTLHKSASRYARQMVQGRQCNKENVIHHPPFLALNIR